MSELASGSPWNAIFLRLLMIVSRFFASSSRAEQGPCAFQVLRRVDTEQHGVDDRDVDAHPGLERAQATSVAALRASRDGQAAAEALRALSSAARGTENLLPRIVDCVKASVTVGEISDALRGEFGEHREGRH